MVERVAMAITQRILEHGRQAAPGGEGKVADGAILDPELVRAGALLHDIGRTKTHGIRHAIEGAELARELGLPEELALVIERHLGAGVDREEAERLGLPPKDYLPRTLEEKIVAHADNLAGNGRKLKLAEVLADLERKGVPQLIPRMEALHRELSGLCGIDIDDIPV
jgi:uncharacterized protein (TIGR00295 family)